MSKNRSHTPEEEEKSPEPKLPRPMVPPLHDLPEGSGSKADTDGVAKAKKKKGKKKRGPNQLDEDEIRQQELAY